MNVVGNHGAPVAPQGSNKGIEDARKALGLDNLPNPNAPVPSPKQFKDALEEARHLAAQPLPPYQRNEALDLRLKRAILPLINICGAKAEALAVELKAKNDQVTLIQDAISKFSRAVDDKGLANITDNNVVKEALQKVSALAKDLKDDNIVSSLKANNDYSKRDAELLRQALETARDRIKREIDDKKTTVETLQKNFYEMWQIFMKLIQEYSDMVSKIANRINQKH